ncbi:PIN domain-containing protein [Arsenicibacter rosenii]|uniref:Nucleotide-binding protein, PIN domain-containing protein n=1 Tax=Arsenicibacter rosenii TaxID=1750698 RepID=A0A1S2VH41_9BACT|nr:PIN domain-containing protein [Arsenicibacter rosenii]OIN58052.1 nucleotide-binding protein, PIN domain-containing protein [Arsenicibacter rosenii]
MSKKVVVIDTNVVFKALRLQFSSFREVINRDEYQFCAPKFLLVEIFKHKEKILRNNQQAEDDFYEYLNLLVNRIYFVNEDVIALGCYVEAYRLCKDIDEKDVPFVALAIELDCDFWTYDFLLKEGLVTKGFSRFFEPVF